MNIPRINLKKKTLISQKSCGRRILLNYIFYLNILLFQYFLNHLLTLRSKLMHPIWVTIFSFGITTVKKVRLSHRKPFLLPFQSVQLTDSCRLMVWATHQAQPNTQIQLPVAFYKYPLASNTTTSIMNHSSCAS